ncbi:PTS sugar transporter subunit IIA [Enterococcus sp. AZ072]|uniref:PTS sugar transporter subunit IIA n=1 Tax=unclassified Enterococcus TaxID=2608891 RepID=UPI003D271454
MYEIIIASHGPLASAMKESLSFFFPENDLYTVEIDQSGIEKFQDQMQATVEQLQGQSLLIFTDLLYGTPFNVAAKCAGEYAKEFEIIAGVNLPCLVEAVNLRKQQQSLKQVVPQLLTAGALSTFTQQAQLRTNDDDE